MSRPYHYSSRGAPPAPPAPVQGRGRAISTALAPAGGRSAAAEPEHRPRVVSLSQTAARSATVLSRGPGQGTREESPDDDDGPLFDRPRATGRGAGRSPCVAARWLQPAAPDADPARARRLLRLRAPIKLFRHPTTSSIIPQSIQTTTSNLLMTKSLATTLPAPRLHTPQTVPGATLGLPRHPRLGCLGLRRPGVA